MKDKKIKGDTYKIKPAGRHILSIGRDLIKDKYAAIVELVKNSYDADSSTCTVSLLPFKKIEKKDTKDITIKGIKVIIRDDGHGMSFDTVTDKWMVPSTDDKLTRNEKGRSPGGRLMQGQKGIGRYSASIIGDDLLLETIQNSESTTLYLAWDDFEKAKYLDDVDVLIENFETSKQSGTEIVIVGNESHLNDWNEKQLKNLKSELKKLIPPVDRTIHTIDDDTENFQITLELGEFPYESYSNKKEIIEPYPLFDLYDYRISGIVTNNGIASLTFENKRTKDRPEFINSFNLELNNDDDKEFQSFCGEIKFDFRVFDRDPSSIDALIERGLKDPITGESVGKREARIILDTYSGIGVYRQGFRIRPLGDAGFDWLSLDNQRVQNPSLKIGSDQIIGFIHIEQEDKSGLLEKSARDGLKETPEYFGLMEISKRVLKELENRRFAYRQKVGLGRSKRKINDKIEGLFNFKEFQEKIDKELNLLGVDEDKRKNIKKIISAKEESNNKIANELKQIIALYQGQATVGKIVNVILHEGRKPLGYFKNQIPLISEWSEELEQKYSIELLEKIINRLSVISEQGNIFTHLFEKLDPLSARKRTRKKDFYIKAVIENVFNVFVSELNSKKIKINIDCNNNQMIFGWKEDYYMILTNLVDNSIYWLQNSKKPTKEISLKVYEENESIVIEYRDNGPGIDKTFIESEIIFEPEFSNKTDGGYGLGLAIAGEAIDRNGGELKAIHSKEGAFFKIESKIQ